MPGVTTLHAPVSTGMEDEMTDEQIQVLLGQAADRVRQGNSLQVFDKENGSQFKFPRLDVGTMPEPYVKSGKGGIAQMDRSIRPDDKNVRSTQIRKVEDPAVVRNREAERKKASAGERWYNLPKTDLTPELKRDLQLLKMRNVLDPHRHYKKDNGKMKAPEYSQIGTIVEGPTEYFSARIQNKDRKRTFVEEVLAGEKQTGRFKQKYGDVQAKKTSGKKAFYKDLKDKRSTSYKKR